MTPPKRPGTSADRDELVRKHSSGVPHELPDEITGQYEGEDLVRIRSKRATIERIARLEVKHDNHELKLATMDGKLDGLTIYAARADAAREAQELARSQAAERRGKWIIALVTALGIAIAAIAAAVVH